MTNPWNTYDELDFLPPPGRKHQHVCANPISGHVMHTCLCGETRNRDGLTYGEWLVLRFTGIERPAWTIHE